MSSFSSYGLIYKNDSGGSSIWTPRIDFSESDSMSSFAILLILSSILYNS